MAEANQTEEPVAKKSGGSKLVVILLIVVVLLLGGVLGGGAWLFLSGKLGAPAAEQGEGAAHEEEKPKKKKDEHAVASYVLIGEAGKPLLANLADTSEADFLQVEVQILTTHPELEAKVKAHMPALRHALLTLFSQQKSPELKTAQGREQLRQQALAEVRKVLEKQAGIDPDEVEDLLFTSFIMQ
ncbi:flagellar basal body-associated FliL family protein [Thiofaba sp. EF100]|uniref:flagellar basal body-associated FliL family protein n=1 Tax=Thiofaba sp. EF100 TaxID=3121274 RepID=UPI003221D307